jgi:RHS repeat-associated protein
MPEITRCVIWGEGPDTRGCLGAGAPGTSVPSPQIHRVLRPAALLLSAILCVPAGPPAEADQAGHAVRDGLPPAPGAPAVDPAFGIAGVGFPIEVPPGRHGLEPSLAVRYSSAAGPGNAGHGFTFDIGSIERSTRHGPPRFDNSDRFVMTLLGESLDLLPIDGASTRFRTVLDTGFLIERVTPGPFGVGSTYWVARGRDGRAYRFGFNGDSAVGNVSQVPDFKWGLDRVEDAQGNVMEIQYQAHALRLYATRIDYTSHPATGLPPANAVHICWERRGDRAPTASGEVFLYRLSSIRTLASGAAARFYSFVYETPAETGSTMGACAAALPSVGPGGNAPLPAPQPPSGRRPSPPRIESVEPAGETPLNASTEATATPVVDSYLTSVRRGDGAGRFLPPVDYSYASDGNPSWPAPAPGGFPPLPFVVGSDADQDSGVRLEDLNRDGRPDLVQFWAHLDGGVYKVTKAVYLNTGAGFVLDTGWTASLMNLVNQADQTQSAYFVLKRATRDKVEMGVRFLDVNDDGYPDLVRIALHYGLGIRKGVFLNTGSGFTADASALYPLPNEPFVDVHANPSRDVSDDRGVRIADVNGDGRADLLVSRATWAGPATRRVYVYDRGTYRLDPGWILPDEPFVRGIDHGRWLDMGVRFVELNRDGLVDLLKAANVDGAVTTVAYMNTGRPGGPSPTWAPNLDDWWLGVSSPEFFVQVTSVGDGASYDRGLRVADVNGDGYSDIVLARSWNGQPSEKFLFTTGPGGGWTRSFFTQFPGLFVTKSSSGAPRDQGVRLADLDGDGGVDYVTSPESGVREWRRNLAWQGRRLLVGYLNGIGGRATITYAPAPHGGMADAGVGAALPFALAVVAEHTVTDGLGGVYTSRYSYEGGFHHHAARDFRGFRRVTVLEPGGAQSVETLFFQQPALYAAPLKGKAEEQVARRAGDGAVFSRSTWSYDATDAAPPLAHPLLRTETFLYDWSTTDARSSAYVRRSATSFAYRFDETTHPPDRVLQSRTERREGSVDDPLDDRAILEEFISVLDDGAALGPAAGRWFLDLPFHRATAGADGVVVAESWTYYDDRTLGVLGSKGLPTAEEARGGPPGPASDHGPGHPDNPRIVRAYDAYGNLTSEIDALGRTRSIGHGASDPTHTFPESDTDPLGRVTTRRFDPRTGALIRVVDPNGRATQIEYDTFGRRSAEYGPYDSAERPTVSYRHDFDAMPARVFRYARERSGLGETTGTAGCIESIAYFDGLGRLIETKSESSGGRMVVGRALTFDAAGRVSAEAEPFFVPSGAEYVPPENAPFTRRFAYDTAGRPVAVTNAAGEVRRETHTGWITTFIDPLGHRRDLHRDAFGSVVRVEDFEGSQGSWRSTSTVVHAYDAAGRLLRTTDPAGSSAVQSFDALGRRTTLDDAHVGSWRYHYDRKGNLLAEIDPFGRTTAMTYDPLDRLIRKDLSDGTRASWNYDEGGAGADALGRLTSIADPTGVQSFSHDRMGRVIRSTRVMAGGVYSVETGFDAMGRVASITVTGGGTVGYEYDEGGNLVSVGPFASSIAYNVRGQVTETRLGNGVRITASYDDATGRPATLQAISPAGARLLDYAYTHLPDGQIATLVDRTDPTSPATQSFTYDGRHRLTRAVGPYGDARYLYDYAGNLLLKEGTGYFYDDPVHPQWITRTSSGQVFSYDPAGNITAIRSGATDRLMSYDATGRMVGFIDTSAGLTVSHVYDASGQRVAEVTERQGSRSVLLTPIPQIEVRDGAATLHYFAGGRRLASVENSGRVLYPISDHLGSTRVVVDDQGKVAARYEFRPYGTSVSGQSDATVSHQFAGALHSAQTGLLLMGSRHYDPLLGRFLQPDPLISESADTQGMNRYAYARDNPINITDPDGRSAWPALLLLGTIALLDRDTRMDAASSVALTAATIFLTGAAGPGAATGLKALAASKAALYAAAVTTVILHTPLGEGILDAQTLLFQELGLSPRASATASRLFSTFLLNSSFQRGFARALAPMGEAGTGALIGGQASLEEYLASRGIDPSQLGPPSGDAYGVPLEGAFSSARGPLELDNLYELVDASGNLIGVYGTRDIGSFFQHGAIGILGHAPVMRNPHALYGLGGISTQQFARELFMAGYSGSLHSLTGRLSDFLIEFVYGPYGGGLAVGINAAHATAGDSGGGP